jgi:hypothetical protein
MPSISSSKDEGRPGSSGRHLGGGGVSNLILEALRDGRGGVESSKEGAASIGVAAGSEKGISIDRAIGVSMSCILSSLPGKMKNEILFCDRNRRGSNLIEMERASTLSNSEELPFTVEGGRGESGQGWRDGNGDLFFACNEEIDEWQPRHC